MQQRAEFTVETISAGQGEVLVYVEDPDGHREEVGGLWGGFWGVWGGLKGSGGLWGGPRGALGGSGGVPRGLWGGFGAEGSQGRPGEFGVGGSG